MQVDHITRWFCVKGEKVMRFEPNNPPNMQGTISVTVIDPNRVPEATILQISSPWSLQVEWNINGFWVPILSPTGIWHVRAYLESLGPGIEAEVGGFDVPVGAAVAADPNSKTYGPLPSADVLVPQIDVPANFTTPAPESEPLTPGLYKLAIVLTSDDGTGPPPTPWHMSGYVEEFLQFY
jgi:hypothetical protein